MAFYTSEISIAEAAKIKALDQITQMQHQLDYDVQDFTVDSLAQEFRAHRIYLPTFQNDWVWDNKQCARSVISGFVVRETSRGDPNAAQKRFLVTTR